MNALNPPNTEHIFPAKEKIYSTIRHLSELLNVSPATQTYLKISEVCELLTISRVTVWRRVNPKHPSYDPNFPKPRKFGGNIRRWLLSEILSYKDNIAAA